MVQDRLTRAPRVGISWSPGFSRSSFALKPGFRQLRSTSVPRRRRRRVHRLSSRCHNDALSPESELMRRTGDPARSRLMSPPIARRSPSPAGRGPGLLRRLLAVRRPLPGTRAPRANDEALCGREGGAHRGGAGNPWRSHVPGQLLRSAELSQTKAPRPMPRSRSTRASKNCFTFFQHRVPPRPRPCYD